MGNNHKKTSKKLEPNWNILKKDFVDKENLSEFVLKSNKTKEEAQKYIDGLNNYASKLKDAGLTTSQLRNIFSRIKKLTNEKIGELPMLKVQLAYTASRNTENIKGKDNYNKKKIIEDFYLLLIALIDKVDENNLEEYKKFMESIIALHKFQGGK